ncbi:unnamed protein product [Cyclocybe aegerita]|uniref:Uncharacterized protein n=1 Tax=Cyclocybe aegerita TaxID=1973307 RepID=A0A8S0XLA7_CYCAE|nr:unnamed protein product [Cyclocybe aegerita]
MALSPLILDLRSTTSEILKVQTSTGISGKYLVRERYVCARHGTGGRKPYVKKNPHWGRKVPSKLTGCLASLTIKSYLSVPYILGIYVSGHNHPLGAENLKFTRIPSQHSRNAGYSEFLNTGAVPSLERVEARGTTATRIIKRKGCELTDGAAKKARTTTQAKEIVLIDASPSTVSISPHFSSSAPRPFYLMPPPLLLPISPSVMGYWPGHFQSVPYPNPAFSH